MTDQSPDHAGAAALLLIQAMLDTTRGPALFLDVDGTLLDIAPQPDAVDVPAALRDALARIARGLDGALALVSGRPVAELDRLFAPLRLAAAGAHGAHWRERADAPVTRQADANLPESARRYLLALLGRYPQLIHEDKGSSFAIHFRNAPELADEIRDTVAHVVADHDCGDLTALAGKSVVEIKRRGFDKAHAIRMLMRSAPFAGRRPIFIGDDVTDEVAILEVVRLGGLALSVERLIAGAEDYFETPACVRAALANCATKMEEAR